MMIILAIDYPFTQVRIEGLSTFKKNNSGVQEGKLEGLLC